MKNTTTIIRSGDVGPAIGTKHNVEHLRDHSCFELRRRDIAFPLYVEVDQIYNLACPASPIY